MLEKIEALRQEMFVAAENLQFETAARVRDELRRLQAAAGISADLPLPAPAPPKKKSSRSAPGRRRR